MSGENIIGAVSNRKVGSFKGQSRENLLTVPLNVIIIL